MMIHRALVSSLLSGKSKNILIVVQRTYKRYDPIKDKTALMASRLSWHFWIQEAALTDAP